MPLQRWLSVGVLLLAGCNNADAPKILTPQEASAASTNSLCENYGNLASVMGPEQQSRAVIRNELTRRGAMSPQDWGDVAADHVQRGMRKCTVLAIYGTPTQVSGAGTIETMVLGDGTIFVGLQNGTVVSFVGPSQ